MSINLPQINVATSGRFNLNLQNTTFDSISWIEFLNESPFTLQLSCGGININIPAWYDYPIQVHRYKNNVWLAVGGAQDPVAINPMLIPILASNQSNVLLVTLYLQGETPAIQTPQPLFRQGWVPNTVNNVGGTATSVQNDGNTGGTVFIEATPFGGVSSDISIDNSGNGYFNGIVEVHGHVIANQITTENLNDLGLTCQTGNKLVFSTGAGHIADVTDSGIVLLQGTIALLTGSLSRINIFNQTVTTILTAYNHGLGVTPTAVIMQLLGTSTTAATGKYDDTTINNTTVSMISSVNATYRIIAIAI